jgi:hypothetical protein
VPEEYVTFVPQEIDTLQSKKILARVLGLPDHQLGHLMTMISRLGSRPHRLLDSIEPSPGQIRLLFCSILTFTHLRAPSRFSFKNFFKKIKKICLFFESMLKYFFVRLEPVRGKTGSSIYLKLFSPKRVQLIKRFLKECLSAAAR